MSGFVRSVIVGIKTSVIEMSSHKLRSALSLLGVLLGVASLVAMLTLIGGIDVYLNEKMGKWAGSVWFWERSYRESDNDISWSRSPGLRLSDGDYLGKESPYVKRVIKRIDHRVRFSIAGVRRRGRLLGVSPSALEDDKEHVKIDRGRWPSEDDFAYGRTVCVLSWEFEERINRRRTEFDKQNRGESLVGFKLIYNKDILLEVIGVYVPKDPDFKPWRLRRTVIVPLTTVQRYVTGFDPHPGTIELSITDVESLQQQADAVARTLKQRHRGVEDFEYKGADWLENITKMLNNAAALMGVVSVISLLVGGLSIMNVMLSSISERIREIGIRKALGAKTVQMFIQFIAESVTLSFLGGLIGMALGMIPLLPNIREAIKQGTEGAIAPTVLPVYMVYVFAVIVGVGILFGLYPAMKASRMNPIEALRYE
ncbi:MAG: FtsX-like permease family protein [Chitinivibrionales bacterium]|nr:FtsX-like permease family protein [Chitinivibrionales bacterium]